MNGPGRPAEVSLGKPAITKSKQIKPGGAISIWMIGPRAWRGLSIGSIRSKGTNKQSSFPGPIQSAPHFWCSLPPSVNLWYSRAYTALTSSNSLVSFRLPRQGPGQDDPRSEQCLTRRAEFRPYKGIGESHVGTYRCARDDSSTQGLGPLSADGPAG